MNWNTTTVVKAVHSIWIGFKSVLHCTVFSRLNASGVYLKFAVLTWRFFEASI